MRVRGRKRHVIAAGNGCRQHRTVERERERGFDRPSDSLLRKVTKQNRSRK